MKQIGLALTGVWLVANGLITIIGLSFRGMHMLMAVLALVAGILLIIRR